MAISEKMNQAIGLATAGKQDEARALLLQIAWEQPHNENAWLWLAQTMPDDAQRIRALEECLRHNPHSEKAKAGLELFRKRQAESVSGKSNKKLPAPKKKSGWLALALSLGAVFTLVLGGFLIFFLSRQLAAQPAPSVTPTQVFLSATATPYPTETATATPTPTPPATHLPGGQISAPEVSNSFLAVSSLPLGLVWDDDDNLRWALNETQPPDGFEEYEAKNDSWSADAAYLTYENEGDIWLLDAATGKKKNLTNTSNREERSPFWMRDRTDVILFTLGYDEGGYEQGLGAIFNPASSGASYQELDGYAAPWFGISPDGTTILTSSYSRNATFIRIGTAPNLTVERESFDISAYGAETASVSKLMGSPAWSPDGNTLAWKVAGEFEGGNTAATMLFNLTTKTVQVIHPYTAPGQDFNGSGLTWSQDGKWLTFYTFPNLFTRQGFQTISHSGQPNAGATSPDLTLRNLETDQEAILGKACRPEAWSPDSQWFIYACYNNSGEDFFVLNLQEWRAYPLKKEYAVNIYNPLLMPRAYHAALNQNGESLWLIGGSVMPDEHLVSVERFWLDNTGFLNTAKEPDLNTPRHEHSATLLKDGRILVVGGYNLESQWLGDAELFESSTGWVATSPPAAHGVNHTATVLQDGRVLVAGGAIACCTITSEVSIFDSQTNTWRSATPMPQPHFMHTATLLEDGSVLIVGGSDGQQDLFNVLRYDPEKDLWEEVGMITKPRVGHKAVLLPDGRVMVSGGWDSDEQVVVPYVEISSPPDYSAWNQMAQLPAPRYGHQMLIYQGNVVVVGGATEWDSFWSADTFLDDVLLYLSESNQWQQVDMLSQPVAFHTVTELNGTLFVAGGRNGNGYTDLFEVITVKE